MVREGAGCPHETEVVVGEKWRERDGETLTQTNSAKETRVDEGQLHDRPDECHFVRSFALNALGE